MEIYQWLFRQNGHNVSDTGYFVYCNGDSDKEAFDGKLEFDIKIIPYEGNTDWVGETVNQAVVCLNSDSFPDSGKDCDYCAYYYARKELEEKS